jgi:hypothetical protein
MGGALDYNTTDDTILTHRIPNTANPDTSIKARAAAATNTDVSMRALMNPRLINLIQLFMLEILVVFQ